MCCEGHSDVMHSRIFSKHAHQTGVVQSPCLGPCLLSTGLAAHLCMEAGGWLGCPAQRGGCLLRSCGASCRGPQPAAAAWCVLAGGGPLCEVPCCCLYPVALQECKAILGAPHSCGHL